MNHRALQVGLVGFDDPLRPSVAAAVAVPVVRRPLLVALLLTPQQLLTLLALALLEVVLVVALPVMVATASKLMRRSVFMTRPRRGRAGQPVRA